MSGETEADPSGWTPDQLSQHFDRILGELDKRYEQRFVAQEKAVHDAFIASEKAVVEALRSASTAVDKALDSNDKRLEAMNEFRGALGDMQRDYITRRETNTLIGALGSRVDELKERADLGLGSDGGRDKSMQGLVAVAGLIIAGLTVAVTLILALN